MSDILEMPTLLSQGYGQIAKMIMADERMTCEAKCIYSLLASFSGAGCAPYPSVEYQLRKLHLSRQRYYRHRRFLTAFGYLVIEQTRDDSHRGNNRYVLSYAPKVNTVELARLRDEWGDKLDPYLAPEKVEALLAAEPREAWEGFERNTRSELRSQNVTVGDDSRNPRSELRSQNATVAIAQESPRSELQSRFLTVENVTTNINRINNGEKQACRPVFPAPPGAGKRAAESRRAPSKAGGQEERREKDRHEPDGFEELAASWPKPVRDRAAAAEAYAAALASGLDPSGIKRAAERYLKAYRAEHPEGEIRYFKQLGPWLLAQDGLGFYARRPKAKRRRPDEPAPSGGGADRNRARSVKLAELSACELRARLAGDEDAADRAAAQREALLAEIEQEGKGGAPCRC